MFELRCRKHTGEDIPRGAGRGVAKALEGAQHWHALALAQTQLFPNSINDSLAAGVDAEVLKSKLEIWHVRLDRLSSHLRRGTVREDS